MSEAAVLLALAQSVATEAGGLARRRREAVDRMAVTATKTTPTDVVTESDTLVETLIRERLLAARPHDGILGEEGGSVAGLSGVEWVVDPIDGTVNYLYGIPQYAVSIAARVDGTVAAGVVHNPATSDTWTAVRGGGAWLNGRPIQVTACQRLAQALVATGFGYDPGRRIHQATVLVDVIPVIRDIRRAGAAALDLCWVATGWLDGYFERGLQPWDMAAGALVATEAGAVVVGPGGGPPGEDLIVAAPPGIVGELRELLERLGAHREPTTPM